MIHEEICTYEVAKLAKEKGFNGLCYAGYDREGGLFLSNNIPNPNMKLLLTDCIAPTQSLLQRWLREEKGIDIVVMPIRPKGYSFFICSPIPEDDGECMDREDSLTYELALEDALKYALEHLI
jgi:hypothetical protein